MVMNRKGTSVWQGVGRKQDFVSTQYSEVRGMPDAWPTSLSSIAKTLYVARSEGQLVSSVARQKQACEWPSERCLTVKRGCG